MIQPLKNNKGMAMVTVVMIMVVLMIFGVSVLSTATADSRHAVVQQRTIQANYLARAAVDDIGNYILEHKILPSGVSVSDEVTLSAGKYTVTELNSFTSSGDPAFYVEVTGQVGETNSKVGLTISEDNPSDVFNHAIYTVSNLDIENMQVNGDVASLGTIIYSESGSNAFDTTQYTATPGYELKEEYEEFPIVDVRTTPVSTWDGTSTVSADSTFDSIDVPNHSTLTFNTGVSGNILTVAINSLVTDVHGSIEVTGDGLLELYIYSSLESKGNYNVGADAELVLYLDEGAAADFQTPLTVYGTDPDKANQVRMFLGEGSSLYLQAGVEIYGYIMGPEANIYFQSSDTTVNGAVIGNILNPDPTSPNGVVNYVVPDDSWEIENAGMSKRFYQ